MLLRALSTHAKPAPRRVLVVGSEGALGRACVESFESVGWRVLRADVAESAAIRLPATGSWSAQYGVIEAALQREGGVLDAVVCTAGGWAGGDARGGAATIDKAEHMARVCYAPAVVSTCVAGERLAPGGLLVLVGSAAALEPTPSMLGYGAAKAATHFLVESASKGGLPAHARVLGILPSTIDTPSNRSAMPKADFSSWTPAPEIATRIKDWVSTLCTQGASTTAVPPSGSLVLPTTDKGRTSWTVVSAPTFRAPALHPLP